MIPRYTRAEMARIWEADNRFRIWLEIETLACEAQAELGVIPKEVVPVIRAKGNFDIARIDAIEAEVKHDVIAFLTSASIASMRTMSKLPLARITGTTSLGITPSSAWASQASVSISSQMRRRLSASQMRAISARV